ncbi:MAG: DNA-processing protein DprA [Prevotella sp.]|nr:DNA-processing protein DprA [Prevotella sp.]
MSLEIEILNAMVLARMNQFHLAGILELYRTLGSATAVMEHRNDIRAVIPDAGPRLVEGLQADIAPLMRRAEEELHFCETKGIQPLSMTDEAYPERLKQCDDAPVVLYYIGNANLNQRRVINIVGTRKCTPYGQDLIRRFIGDLRMVCPEVLIVSGLAYGVDICAHRNALEHGFETVGVLAHGLDDLYPSRHKDTANRMVGQGGLLTEFMTGTNADKINFVRRNRIVAGMSDACILVESAAKGGGLITASISRGYGRDVFAFPGRVGDEYSEGCNNLIRDNGAALISSADDFVRAMGWESDALMVKAQNEGIQRNLFPDLSPEEQTIVEVLQRHNDLQINMLATQTNIPVNRLTALLFELEMKGVVRTLAGGMYHLFLGS